MLSRASSRFFSDALIDMGRPFKAVATPQMRRVRGFVSPVARAQSVCTHRAGSVLHMADAAKLYGGSHQVPHTMVHHSGRPEDNTMGKMPRQGRRDRAGAHHR
ncbi:hypothetical protein A8B83_13545 [Rhodobacteraceae bacterium EhC02]|nr:hypothetical protein A8B83_13545 [Rhodobacteraceae bacterium EhC02]